jgi:FeS assembly protein IscX
MTQNYIWDDAYAIACALKKGHPNVDLEDVTLNMIYDWTISLDNFVDEPELANDEILTDIYKEWIEEINN